MDDKQTGFLSECLRRTFRRTDRAIDFAVELVRLSSHGTDTDPPMILHALDEDDLKPAHYDAPVSTRRNLASAIEAVSIAATVASTPPGAIVSRERMAKVSDVSGTSTANAASR